MSEQIRSAELLVKTALSTPGVLDRLKTNPEETLKSLESQAIQQLPRALEQDKWIYRMVVGALGIVVIAVVLGAILYTVQAKDPVNFPAILTALAATAIGALAGLLAPSPTGK